MQLSANFKLSEFQCHDGSVPTGAQMDNLKALVEQLQILRDYTGKSITIVSGYRSPAWNTRVGGAGHSQHMEGRAADLNIDGYTPQQSYDLIEKLIKEGKLKNGGLGIYAGWVHYDVGPARRWCG
jgi:uncharacterized protein YcbK (DUF882 family)